MTLKSVKISQFLKLIKEWQVLQIILFHLIFSQGCVIHTIYGCESFSIQAFKHRRVNEDVQQQGTINDLIEKFLSSK